MEELIRLAKESSRHCIGMEGNVSAKINDGLLIKASGTRLNQLTTDDIVGYDMYGRQLSNHGKRGSMELSFHTFLLDYSWIKYVSHTHPNNTLKILCSDWAVNFSKLRLFPDQVVFNGKTSCFVPYAKPGDELTKMIKKCVVDFTLSEGYFPKLILLENHGIITCGGSVDECIMANDICEKSADIFIGAKTVGVLTPLSYEQINELVLDKNEQYRQDLLK